MASRYDERYEAETAASGTIVEAYRQALDSDDDNDDSGISLAVVHYRGGQTEFDLGCYYAASQDALDRATGAAVLSQLGWGDKCFHDESVEVLLRLVGDQDERVIVAAALRSGTPPVGAWHSCGSASDLSSECRGAACRGPCADRSGGRGGGGGPDRVGRRCRS